MKSRIRWARYKVLTAGKNAYRIFAGRPTCRCDDNIKTYLKETRWECGLDSSGSGQRLVAGSCENEEFLTWLSKLLASQGPSSTELVISGHEIGTLI
jgi:hypothetical protein